LRETESPIEAKKLTPWLLPTHHPQASASFPRVRPSLNAQPRNSDLASDAGLALGERASQRNSELAPNARLALGERASEPKELRARSQCWTCSGRASERELRERGSNDDSATDARVRPSQCLGNDDVLRTESALYLTISSESCNLWKPGIQSPYYM
jgi:hypothetical protein